MKNFVAVMLLQLFPIWCVAQFCMDKKTMCPSWTLNGKVLLSVPEEGLWSIATDWRQDWMDGWKHAYPEKVENSGDWVIVSGKMVLPQGTLWLRDAYREEEKGRVRCRRRFEWQGNDTLRHVNLSVRLRLKGKNMQAFMPGILYYGNKNGAKVNPNVIPVYTGALGEFAIFEDHRFPMPFAMLENAEVNYAAALHTTPSPVRGAVLDDQWWSLGVEAGEGYTDLVLYSGPIGYNGKHGVAKALQFSPMPYTQTYIDMEPGRIIEKEFCVELYEIEGEGTGFQRPLYTSLDLYKPYGAEAFTDYHTIINEKYRFAKNRWIEFGRGVEGFNMYDLSQGKSIVMGWCGQADSPGYALQLLEEDLGDKDIPGMVQRSMDFLSTYPVDAETGMFPVGFNGEEFYGGDPVSCG